MRNDDHSIRDEILKGNEDVLLSFYRQYNKPLIGFISRTISDRVTVDDIVQETFFDFTEALQTFHFQSSLKTFLFSIAKFKVYDALKKKKKSAYSFSSISDHVMEKMGAIFDADMLEQKEQTEEIVRVFEKLPDDYRIVLRLKYEEDKSLKEIAGLLQMNLKATESLLYRARQSFIKIFSIENS